MAASSSIPSDVIEDNENLVQQVKELKDENKNLQKSIDVLLKDYEFSKNKKKRELQLENEKLGSENLDLNYCISHLHFENQALRQQVEAKENACEQKDQELKNALAQLKSSEDYRKEFKEYLDQLSKGVACLLDGVKTEKMSKCLKNHDANESTCELQSNFQQEKDQMRHEILAPHFDLQAETIMKNFRALEINYCMMKQENECFKKHNQDLKEEVEAKNSALQEQAQELLSILEQLKSSEDDKNRIRQYNKALELEVQELNKKLADCQKEVRQNEEALQEKMHHRHEEYEMEKLTLQQKVEDLQKDNQAFRLQNDAAIQSMCELKENFQKEKDEMKQQIQALQNDIHEANETLQNFKEFKELYGEIKQENECLSSQNQGLKQEIEAKNIAVQEKVKELKCILQELKSSEADNNRIQLDKCEPQLTPKSNESIEKGERIKTSKNTDLEEKNKDNTTKSSSHMETPQEQTDRAVKEEDQGGWITWLRGAALHFALSHYN
ncbi:ERC protein 2-like [Oreochromis aureus]|uniref:ERC protein 2-like n=1 Tax=Oreochromis aureus TaxID=47969 RepID=UPI001953552C|nr:ERC protein 2-like [Oreochromis aureus]